MTLNKIYCLCSAIFVIPWTFRLPTVSVNHAFRFVMCVVIITQISCICRVHDTPTAFYFQRSGSFLNLLCTLVHTYVAYNILVDMKCHCLVSVSVSLGFYDDILIPPDALQHPSRLYPFDKANSGCRHFRMPLLTGDAMIHSFIR